MFRRTAPHDLPSTGLPPSGSSLTTLGSVVALVPVLLGSPSAWADCTSTDSVTYTCAGATVSNQTITGSNLNVTVDSSFASNLTSGDVINVTNSSGPIDFSSSGSFSVAGTPTALSGLVLRQNGNGLVRVNQVAGSATGEYMGLFVVNAGTGGATQVTTAANATALNNYAIYVVGEANAGDISIQQSAGTLSGLNMGIAGATLSSGALEVTTASTVMGDTGINLSSISTTGSGRVSFVQTAGSITGGKVGVEVNQSGVGPLSVATSANVAATTGPGIRARQNNAANSQPLSITQSAGRIAGVEAGIDVKNANATSGITSLDLAGAASSSGTAQSTDTIETSTVYSSGSLSTQTATTTELVANALPAAVAVRSARGATVLNLNAGADIAATSGWAIRAYGSSDTVTLNSGSKVKGRIALGSGNDVLAIKGSADISGVTLLDGGNSLYDEQRVVTVRRRLTNALISGPTVTGVVSDILGTANAATNQLIFQDTTQSLAGSAMKNWQTVTLGAASVAFAGDAALTTGTGTNPDSSPQGLVLQGASTLTSPVALAITGDVSIGAGSALRHAVGGSIAGNLFNAGLIYWGNLGQTLTVTGNYSGAAGSALALETSLGGDGSASDTLHVTGDTSGTTQLTVRPASGSPGALTSSGILVVQVDGNSNGVFSLAGGQVNAGQYSYTLKKVGKNWYLQSTLAPVTSLPSGTVVSATTTDTTPPITGTVNDAAATVRVTINGVNYNATNNGNGTWTLADNIVAALSVGSAYPVTVTFTDAASNVATASGTITIVSAAAAARPVPTLSDAALWLLSLVVGAFALLQRRR